MSDEYNYEPYQYSDLINKNEEKPTENVNMEETPVEPVEENTSFVMVEPTVQEPGSETQVVEETAFAESTVEFSYESEAESAQEDAQAAAQEEKTDTGYAPRYDYSYATQQEPPKKKKKKGGAKKWVACVAMAVVFGLVASVVFQASNAVLGRYFGTNNSGKSIGTTQVSTSTNSKVNSDIADVAENVMPSVVSITNMGVQEVQNYFFGGVTQYPSQSSGSGIIIGQNNAELLIVSNNHVVEGSTTLTVTFVDDTSVEAQIKGTDADRDLAIISVPLTEVESTTLDAIKVAVLGDSDALRVGETTIAIGNALGYGQSVTTGIVSAVERTIEDFEGELIQTDAAINPGNSGGALLNANGEVIGINTVKVNADAVEGMGYAIPISDVTDILNELMNRETRTKVAEDERGSIGISGRTVDETVAEAYNMPQGVFVYEVVEGSGAERAGLPVGSIITEIDGIDVDSLEELQEQLEYYRAGETVEFTIEVQSEGGYVEKTIEITLYKMN